MTAFKVIIRIVFLFAYGAFLYASLHHVAYFYHSFEADSNNWFGSYALAIAIDVTALVLMIGVMFFHKGMPLHALIGTWFFIFCLTGFSWIINWEYAVQFQSQGLDKVGTMYWINPVMASAFAFLNLAYSVVAGFFNSESESVEELQQKLDDVKQVSLLKRELFSLRNQQQSSYISGKIRMFKSVISSENVSAIPEQATNTLEPDVPEVLPEIEEKNEPKAPIHLGMIEQRMHEAFMQHPQEAQHLIRLSQEQSLAQFVETLQAQYSQYASYITPERVSHVMQYIGEQNKEEIPAPEEKHIDLIPDKYFMTWEQAVVYTGYAESTLKKQLKAGEIETNKKGDKLKVSTLKIKPGMTAHMPVLPTDKVPATNGLH